MGPKKFHVLVLNNVELLRLLDLSCDELLNVYEALLPLHEGEKGDPAWDCFLAEVSGFLSNRTYHHRVKHCPSDSVRVLERALSMKSFDIRNVDFIVREGFFDQLRFTDSMFRECGVAMAVPPKNYRGDPMPDHYLVKESFLLHWAIRNGFTQTAIYMLKQRPVKCTFGYAPTWANRRVGKSIFNLVLEQSTICHADKDILIKEIEQAMADSCLDNSH